MTRKIEDDDFLITLPDVYHIFLKNRKVIFLGTFLCSLLALWFALSKPISYTAEASFRLKGNSQSGIGKSFTDFLQGSSGSNDSEVISLMKSRKLMDQVVKRLNLQMVVSEKNQATSRWSNPLKNLQTECAHFKKRQTPLFQERKPLLLLEKIEYNTEIPTSFSLHFTSPDSYLVKNATGEFLGQAKLGEPFKGREVTFTLIASNDTPLDKKELDKKEFLINAIPIAHLSSGLSASIKLEPVKTDKNLLSLKYTHLDRSFAIRFINEVMTVYQQFLKEEHDNGAEIQLLYLEKKKRDSHLQQAKLLRKHAIDLSHDVSQSGIVDAEKELDFLLESQKNMSERIRDIDLELNRLEYAQSLEDLSKAYELVNLSSPSISGITHSIHQLNQQKDGIDIAIRSLRDRFLYNDNCCFEFQGIDLTGAERLYMEFCKQKSDVEAEIRQIAFVLEQLKQPEFEVSGLSPVLRDATSSEIIRKTSELSLLLHDQNNRSTKERERIRDEIYFQKVFMTTHLQQVKDLLQLREDLFNEKIYALQTVSAELIQQKISILNKHFLDHIAAQIYRLQQERILVEKSLSDLNKKMAKIPERRVSETLIMQTLTMNKSIVEEITKLVEGKNVSHNLELIRSSPLDLAHASLLPNSPRLLFFSILGAFLGLFATSGFVLGRSIFTGLLASADNLRLSHQHVSGVISLKSDSSSSIIFDEDLATLRRLDSYFSQNSNVKGNLLLLILGKGPDYSQFLAELMGVGKQKVLLLSLSFTHATSPDNLPGLLQVLQGENSHPKILKEKYYDRIVAGGISRFATEYVQSTAFQNLISQLKDTYDWIIAVSDSMPCSAESEILATLFPNIAVTLTEERLLDLSPYTKYAKVEPQTKKVSFLFASLLYRKES